MMPNVSISSSNFTRLQKLATPLVDDLDSVISKILDAYERTVGSTPPPTPVGEDEDLSVKTYPIDSPPPLTYTQPTAVLIDGKPFDNKYWNPVLFEMIGLAAKKIGIANLKPHLDVNYRDGVYEKFNYIADADISVQGRDANLCWRSILKVAKAAKIPVTIDFYWQDAATAAHPGRTGRFVYDGK
jgi:hypothetical protein